MVCCRTYSTKHNAFLIAIINNILIFGGINIPLVLFCLGWGFSDAVGIIIGGVFTINIGASAAGFVSLFCCPKKYWFYWALFVFVAVLELVGSIVTTGFFLVYIQCWPFLVTTFFGIASTVFFLLRTAIVASFVKENREEDLYVEGERRYEEEGTVRSYKIALSVLLAAQFIVCLFVGLAYYFTLQQYTFAGIDPPAFAYPLGISGALYMYMFVMGMLFIHTHFEQYYWSLMVLETLVTVFVMTATGWMVVLTWNIIPFLFLILIFWCAIITTTALVIKRNVLATTTHDILVEENAVEMSNQEVLSS